MPAVGLEAQALFLHGAGRNAMLAAQAHENPRPCLRRNSFRPRERGFLGLNSDYKEKSKCFVSACRTCRMLGRGTRPRSARNIKPKHPLMCFVCLIICRKDTKNNFKQAHFRLKYFQNGKKVPQMVPTQPVCQRLSAFCQARPGLEALSEGGAEAWLPHRLKKGKNTRF